MSHEVLILFYDCDMSDDTTESVVKRSSMLQPSMHHLPHFWLACYRYPGEKKGRASLCPDRALWNNAIHALVWTVHAVDGLNSSGPLVIVSSLPRASS